MVVRRGDVWWANLPDPVGSEPGYRRPILILQIDQFNESRIATVLAAIVTKNLSRADSPGNVYLPKSTVGLRLESVVNVSQILTVDKRLLMERIGKLPRPKLLEVEVGVRFVMGL